MGLAGPRKRVKISHDPNNTAWIRADNNFGQKILTAQGWAPGSFLGAADAPHAGHYSAASASHVRVLVKEGSLGVGASRRQADTQEPGLGSFQDLLGRLNGKSEEQIGADEAARKDLGRRTYAAQRFGSTKFVKAGYLVGDRIEKLPVDVPSQAPANLPTQEIAFPNTSKTTSRRNPTPVESQPKLKNRKERRRASSVDAVTEVEPVLHRTSHANEGNAKEPDTSSKVWPEAAKLKRPEAAKRKRLKREKKVRREERESKRALKAGNVTVPGACNPPSVEPLADLDSVPATTASPPKAAPITTLRSQGVRQRYIQQKRMAGMDPRALQEILMLKPVK